MLYPWLKVPYQEITSCLTCNDSCTVLLQSNSGYGIKKLYYAIIKQMFCKCKQDATRNNFCLNCQLLSENNHPDLYNLSKSSTLNKQIGIDIIREVCAKIFYPPYYGDIKIILIQNLEFLTNQAMHALLKTIEEPPKKTYFILGCKKINYILPTILSRSKMWSIFVKKSDSLQWLNKQGYTELKKNKIVLNFCNGAPIYAKKMLSSDFWNIRKKMILILKKIFSEKSSFFHLFESCQKIDIFFMFINSFTIDAIRYKSNIFVNIINIDCIKIIEYISKICSAFFLYQQWEFWLNFKELYSHVSGINKELFLVKTILAWNNLIQEIK